MTLHVDIAGIHFTTTAPAGLELFTEDPRYACFLGEPVDARPRVEVPVRLVLDPPPDLTRLAPAFDSGGPWRVWRDGEDLLFEYRVPEPPPGVWHWTARYSPAEAAVTVHCGDPLRRRGGLLSPICYPLDQILLMCLLPRHHGVLVHSAGVRIGERAIVLPGRSGAGKSTFSRLIEGRADFHRISDDRMVLRRSGDELRAWGTPWAGTERIAENEDAPLAALAFLHQSPTTHLRRIEPGAGLAQLLPVASVPWFDEGLTSRCLAFCDEVLRGVPLYELHFRRHEEVQDAVGELLSELA